jgi:hypothetical protein
MSDREASTWRAVRERGRRRYILMTGIIGTSLPVAFISPFVAELLFDRPGPLLGRLAVSLAISPLGGFWFGQKMWTDNERRYLEWRGRWKTDPVPMARRPASTPQ